MLRSLGGFPPLEAVLLCAPLDLAVTGLDTKSGSVSFPIDVPGLPDEGSPLEVGSVSSGDTRDVDAYIA